jgi:hypothetical protein
LNHTWAELAVNINAVEMGDRVWTGMTHWTKFRDPDVQIESIGT